MAIDVNGRPASILMIAKSKVGFLLNDSSRIRAAVGKPDFDSLDFVDHVLIGQDIAARVDHDSRSHAVDAGVGFPRRRTANGCSRRLSFRWRC